MTLTALLLFASVYFVAVASPGPGMAAVIARGLGRGRTAGGAFIAGFLVGDLIWFTVAATGLSVLAESFGPVVVAIKYLGCAYLLFMAYKIWTAPVGTAQTEVPVARGSSIGAFAGSLSLTLGNPKVIVFFLSVMPLVVDLNAVTPLVFVEMALVIAIVLSGTLGTALIMASRARDLFRSERALRRMNRGTAGVMAGTAVAIAFR
jgi:threonine/homoserine/homoserine lactone efflux protein